ncbi:DUF763 domain-containing protein [Patescibacteria group bacterium]|nr:DUF763 domain-containing protein [Patescibacteria group bacterium]
MHRGVATFTLDHGKAPRWLFWRMVKLARAVVPVIVDQYGPEEFVKRMADPVWFQSLGCVLAFDWNASGLTTTVTGALKEAIRGQEKDLGLFVCGGKGRTSRKTPDQIKSWGEALNFSPTLTDNMVYNSKMTAKVDSSLIQDDFQLYHHCFFFSTNQEGKLSAWSVVQQGMDIEAKSARRYHWYSRKISDLIVDPHAGIISDPLQQHKDILNLTAKKSADNRQLSLELASSPQTLFKDFKILAKHTSSLSQMIKLKSKKGDQLTFLKLAPKEFKSHKVLLEDFSQSAYLKKIFNILSEKKPQDYENLLSEKGVGPKTIRALSLVSEVIYGAKASYEDPARYTFAHGGKDGTPYFVDRTTYGQTMKAAEMLQKAVRQAKIEPNEKQKALLRLEKRKNISLDVENLYC